MEKDSPKAKNYFPRIDRFDNTKILKFYAAKPL